MTSFYIQQSTFTYRYFDRWKLPFYAIFFFSSLVIRLKKDISMCISYRTHTTTSVGWRPSINIISAVSKPNYEKSPKICSASSKILYIKSTKTILYVTLKVCSESFYWKKWFIITFKLNTYHTLKLKKPIKRAKCLRQYRYPPCEVHPFFYYWFLGYLGNTRKKHDYYYSVQNLIPLHSAY